MSKMETHIQQNVLLKMLKSKALLKSKEAFGELGSEWQLGSLEVFVLIG